MDFNYLTALPSDDIHHISIPLTSAFVTSTPARTNENSIKLDVQDSTLNWTDINLLELQPKQDENFWFPSQTTILHQNVKMPCDKMDDMDLDIDDLVNFVLDNKGELNG